MILFKVLGAGDIQTISFDEFLELYQETILDENDVTIFGELTDSVVTFRQGKIALIFRIDVLDGIVTDLKKLLGAKKDE